jgi:hypothetical protein
MCNLYSVTRLIQTRSLLIILCQPAAAGAALVKTAEVTLRGRVALLGGELIEACSCLIILRQSAATPLVKNTEE